MTSYLDKPVRTMWEAARDLFKQAHDFRDAELWERAYRLWVQASASNAPGTPWMLTHYRPLWLPTSPPALGNGELDAGRTSHQDRRGWTPA